MEEAKKKFQAIQQAYSGNFTSLFFFFLINKVYSCLIIGLMKGYVMFLLL